jgi:hypothetical protein
MGRKQLIELAKKIPHMGAADIGKKLIDHAAEVKNNHYIVECGVWMGSGTAFLAIGAGKEKKIFCYDHFLTNSNEIEKLKKHDIEVEYGIDTLPMVAKNLKPFDAKIYYHKNDLLKFEWIGKPIGLYVDDVSKRNPYWTHVVKTFFPHLVVGAVVILMDFHFYKKTGKKSHKTQLIWMNKHKDYFEKIWESECKAAFRLKKQFRPERENK